MEDGVHLVASRLKMVAVKDFRWEKTASGWQDANCPLGEGMVDWKYVFGELSQAGFQGPISLHLEYEVPGPTTADHEQNILAAAPRDLRLPESSAEGRGQVLNRDVTIQDLTPSN